MRRPRMVVIASLLLLLISAQLMADGRHDGGDVFEDDGTRYPGWLCTVCRTPANFAAFAYNAYWSDSAWALGSRIGVPFRVYNLAGDWVVIWFEDFLFDIPTLLPSTVMIKVWLRSGQIVNVEMVKGLSALPIGGSGTGSVTGGSGGGTSGGGPALVVTSSATGVVSIIDPDKDGNFPGYEFRK